MFDANISKDTAAHEKFGGQAQKARINGRDEIVQNLVGHRFMKTAFVAESPDVKLQTFEFDAEFVWNIVKRQRGKVGLTGDRAQAGKFGDFHMNLKIALHRRIREGRKGF